jgi:hypothetical protein
MDACPAKIKYQVIKNDSESATLRVLFPDEIAVVAYKESEFPAVLVTRNNFSRDTYSGQQVDFEKIEFTDFPGYKVWCCEVVEDELRVCLAK